MDFSSVVDAVANGLGSVAVAVISIGAIYMSGAVVGAGCYYLLNVLGDARSTVRNIRSGVDSYSLFGEDGSYWGRFAAEFRNNRAIRRYGDWDD